MDNKHTVLISKVYILNVDNEALVLRRSASDQRWAMDWDLPGGAIELGEDPKLTAARESLEETNLHISPEDLKLLDVSSLSDGQPAITITYFTSSYTGTLKLSFEHDDYSWVSLSEMKELQMPTKYKIAANILKDRLNV